MLTGIDAEKKKYFKIQPNQAVSSAAKYSHQSVKARNKRTKVSFAFNRLIFSDLCRIERRVIHQPFKAI